MCHVDSVEMSLMRRRNEFCQHRLVQSSPPPTPNTQPQFHQIPLQVFPLRFPALPAPNPLHTKLRIAAIDHEAYEQCASRRAVRRRRRMLQGEIIKATPKDKLKLRI